MHGAEIHAFNKLREGLFSWHLVLHKLLHCQLVGWKGLPVVGSQNVQKHGGKRMKGASDELRDWSLFLRAALRMNRGCLDEDWVVLLFWLQKQSNIEMGDAENIFLCSADAGGGFVNDLFHELGSL